MMANQVQKWLSKKKNRKMLFFLLGVVCLFFYVRNRSAVAPGYGSLPGTTPGTGSGNATTRVVPYPPGNGIMSPKLADYGSLEHLNIHWTGSDGDWTAEDLSTLTAPAGFRIRYYNGGQTIITDTPLKNFKWESNNMISFHKCLIKNGVEDLYFWARNADDPLRRPDDGYTMSGNTSVAHQTFYFNKY
jgi:hypothetical protein